MLELEGRKVFAEVYGPPPRLLVYGAVDTAESLAAAANLLGWTTIVADARAKFATRERIPSADELIVAWPEETFAQVAPDHATAIVLLTHDDKFDLPALELALASDAFYIGLIGGRRNQEKKRERLRELGVDETSIERIAGPCGLDIGADAGPEVALSILAEAMAARNGRDGGPLKRSAQRIHVEDANEDARAVMHEPGKLRVEEIELDEPLPGEVVVRMSAVGVCGTDLHSYKGEWNRPTPIVLGHEGAGVIEAVGGEANGLREGDRVVLSWAPACGECGPCRRGRPAACGPLSSAIGRGTLLDGRTGLSLGGETLYRGTATGALAERVVVAAGAAMPFGDDVPLEEAALLGCAALTGVGAVLNAARPEPGFTALVIGAGGVGQFVVQGARIAGATEILVVDPVEARREQALGLGATRACAPDDVREAIAELDREGVDYAFDAVGAPATTKLALRWTRAGGTAVLVGLPAAGEKLELDPLEFSNREKTLAGTIYGSEDPAVALPRMLELVRAGELELASLVGPSFPLDRADEAFQASLAGEPGRVLVTP